MISLDLKAKSSPQIGLGIQQSDEKPTLSFSDLLKGVSLKEDAEIVQNGIIVLSLDDEKDVLKDVPKETKESSSISSLLALENELELKTTDAQKEPIALNSLLSSNLTPKELRVLIKDAKKYLENKIVELSKDKKIDIKELPKTLKGLVEISKKLGLDVSKITLEDVKFKTKEINFASKTNVTHLAKAIKENKKEKLESIPVLKSKGEELQSVLKFKAKTDVSEKVKTEDLPKVAVNEKVKVKTEDLPKVAVDEKVKVKTEDLPKVAVDTKEQLIQTKSKEQIQKPTQEQLLNNQTEDKEVQTKLFDTEVKTKSPLKPETLIFKAKELFAHSTEQLVRNKQFNITDKNLKTKNTDRVENILKTEKTSLVQSNLVKDISVVATSKILTSNGNENINSLSSLLQNDNSETSSPSTHKIETNIVNKADGFDVKLNEAKQMVKYLSQDVKNAIEDYKAPFTRIKVQLNPQKLGEVDLTIIQRGKNLHITLSSNNAAINTLALNASDLKANLNISGINNATLNFNNSSQDENSFAQNQNAQQEQQQKQQEQKAKNEYSFFENEEQNEEILDSLEIVVPHYA